MKDWPNSKLTEFEAFPAGVKDPRSKDVSFSFSNEFKKKTMGFHNFLFLWMFRINKILLPHSGTASILDQLVFYNCASTKSQARRAIQEGRVLVLSSTQQDEKQLHVNQILTLDQYHELLSTGNHSSTGWQTVSRNDRILWVDRDATSISRSYPTFTCIAPPLMKLYPSVVYQNDEFAVVRKPEGIVTIGKEGTALQTLAPFLLEPPPSHTQGQGVGVPQPVHRLDRSTSGLVLIAKTKEARSYYGSLFLNRNVEKKYLAIVEGSVPENGTEGVIDYPIDGKEAITEYKVLSSSLNQDRRISLLDVTIRTGRTHQIRRHLKYCLETPIWGDPKYNPRTSSTGMYLCAYHLSFDDMEFTIEAPQKFQALLQS